MQLCTTNIATHAARKPKPSWFCTFAQTQLAAMRDFRLGTVPRKWKSLIAISRICMKPTKSGSVVHHSLSSISMVNYLHRKFCATQSQLSTATSLTRESVGSLHTSKMRKASDPSPTSTTDPSKFPQRGGRDLPYNRMVRPSKHPVPPRPRPTIFYYLVTLVYAQNGFTRKFRHFLPCQHNVVFHAIADTPKRHLYAAGSDCLICPCCDETIISHIHLNIFQCPTNNACPMIRKVPAMQIQGRIEHFCGLHQMTVPHPNDLNVITNLPVPLGAPCQFSFHSSVPQDSMLVVNALYGRQQPITAFPTTTGPVLNPHPAGPSHSRTSGLCSTYPLLSQQLENVSSILRFPRVDTRNPEPGSSARNHPPPTPQEARTLNEAEAASEFSSLAEENEPELTIDESEVPPIVTDDEDDPQYVGEAALNLSSGKRK